jgi:hypothetical protein
MSIFTGTTELANIYAGTTEIKNVYAGTNLIYVSVQEGRLFIYVSDDSKFKEIDVNTKAVINVSSATNTSSQGYGLGGLGSSRLIRKTYNTTDATEMDMNTLLTISGITFSVSASGLEGTYDRLFIGGASTMYEVDKNTYTIITTGATNRTTSGRDVGCINNRVYGISDPATNISVLQEFDPTTLAVINTANAPSGSNTNNIGIGGVNRRLFSTDVSMDLIYELDIDTMAVTASTATPNPYGIGGTKTYSM